MFNLCMIDPRAEVTRSQMRALPLKDFASGTMRLALHLSDLEAYRLEALNPDTLGHDDAKLRDRYWADFAKSSESNPFKVRNV